MVGQVANDEGNENERPGVLSPEQRKAQAVQEMQQNNMEQSLVDIMTESHYLLAVQKQKFLVKNFMKG